MSSFIKGAIIITIATMLSKIIGSVYRIPLQNIAGDEVLGIFIIVYPVYMSVLILTVAGIPLAISKLIAEARVDGRKDDIYYIYRTATILALGFGLISTGIMVGFADYIAIALGGSFAYYSILVVSITLLFAPYMAVYRGFFQGFEDMKPTAISQVLEQLVRVVIILVAAYLLTMQHRSEEVVAAGVMVGSIIGVLASLVYLLMLFRKQRQSLMEKAKYNVGFFKDWSKRILIVAIPICIGALTMAFLNMVDSLTIPVQLGEIGHSEGEITNLYGIYGRGLTLVQIAVVFASALILPLIPRITSAVKKGEMARTRHIIEKANKFTHLTAWPAAIGLTALTLPVNLALFTDLEENTVIAILSFSALFTAFSVLTTGILQGMNRAKHAAVIVIVAAVIKVVLNLVLVSQFGLVGAAVSTLVTYIILTVANLFMMYRATPFSIFQREGIVYALGSLVMGAAIASPLYFLNVSEWSRLTALLYLCVMIALGGVIYVAFIIIFKGVKKDELEALPIIGGFLNRTSPSNGGSTQSTKGREDGFSLIRKILWGIVALSLLLSIPALLDRVNVEQKNNTYEISVPYEQIREIIELGEGVLFSREEFFSDLKENGVNSVGLEPITIEELEKKFVLREVTKDELIRYYRVPTTDLPAVNGLFLEIIEEDHPYVDQLMNAFNFEYETMKKEVAEEGFRVGGEIGIERLEIDDRVIYFLPNANGKTKLKPLGFDMEMANEMVDAGLNVIPRISKDISFVDQKDHYIYEQLAELRDLGSDRLLFLGQEVVGKGIPEDQKQFGKYIKELGYNIVTVEFFSQQGLDSLIRAGELQSDVVRLLSLRVGKGQEKKVQGEVEKAVRAVKERNIRIFYINPLAPGESYQNTAEALKGLEGIYLLANTIHDRVPDHFVHGIGQPYEVLEKGTITHLIVLLGSAAFIVLFVNKVLPKLTILGAIGAIGVVGLQFVTGHSLILKAIALLVGVLAAILTVLYVGKINNMRQLFLQYFRSVGIALVGAVFIVLLLYGTPFLVKTDYFTGVKVLAAFPLVLGGLIFFFKEIIEILRKSVKYWHLAVFAVIGVALIYYVMRTGNEAVTVGAELRFRQLLEDILYVRPRTTQFLIGLPLFFFGLYLTMLKKKYAKLFLAAGFLAFASMVGTFTHLHTPLYVSGLRTLYSALSGIILGFVWIVVYRIWTNQVYPRIKSRWEL